MDTKKTTNLLHEMEKYKLREEYKTAKRGRFPKKDAYMDFMKAHKLKETGVLVTDSGYLVRKGKFIVKNECGKIIKEEDCHWDTRHEVYKAYFDRGYSLKINMEHELEEFLHGKEEVFPFAD